MVVASNGPEAGTTFTLILANGKKAPVPRHNEIKDTLCKLIRKQLGLHNPE